MYHSDTYIQKKFFDSFSRSTFDLEPQVLDILGDEFVLEETRDIEVFTSDIDDSRFGYFEFCDSEGYRYSVMCKVVIDEESLALSISDFYELEKSEFTVYHEPDRSFDPKWSYKCRSRLT